MRRGIQITLLVHINVVDSSVRSQTNVPVKFNNGSELMEYCNIVKSCLIIWKEKTVTVRYRARIGIAEKTF